MTNTFCKDCGTKLDEPSDTPIEARTPCPNCGSVARAFEATVGVTITPPTIVSTATAFPPTIVTGPAGDQARIDEAVETLPPIVQTLKWLEPSDEEGSWTLQAFNSSDELLGMSEAKTFVDAILAIAEQLDPKRQNDDG